jgi:long-subunit fatty acid transport protein
MSLFIWQHKNIYNSLCIIALATLFVGSQSFAQYPEDALRFATPGFGIGARSLGMGNAYTGVASDYSALYWNPAGLAQMHLGEFSAGLSVLNFQNNSTFFGAQQSYSNNSTHLNAFGVVLPVPVRRGNLVFAFGYDRNSEFTTGLSFSGFNPNSSIIQTYAQDGTAPPGDLSGNLAYQLFLADTAGGKFKSPITNRVTQIGKVLEGGGLNNWSAGGAIDIGKELSVGLTLTSVSGTYRYDRNYREQDNAGIYPSPYDFKELVIDDFVESDISGFNMKFGLLYRVPDRFRFGVAVKTPTWFNIKETFGTTGSTTFRTIGADGKSSYGPFDNPGSGEYDVNTPWVLSAGGSVILHDLVLSADVDYTDWTQLEFKNANPDVLAKNKEIKDIFQATTNGRVGAEYDLKDYGIRVRGGFMYYPSPFQEDKSSSFDQKYVTAGLGFSLGEFSMFDLAYAHGWWKTFQSNYDRSSLVDEDVKTNIFMATLSYRF